VADKKASGVRAVFLIIFGFIFIGIGASLFYGELGFGTLTNHTVGQQSGNTLAYLPIGLGVVLMIAGFVLAIFDRRAT